MVAPDFCRGRKQGDQSNQFHPTASETQSGRASKGQGRLDALGMELVTTALLILVASPCLMSAPQNTTELKRVKELKETSKII